MLHVHFNIIKKLQTSTCIPAQHSAGQEMHLEIVKYTSCSPLSHSVMCSSTIRQYIL
jgi:hypothetical protein